MGVFNIEATRATRRNKSSFISYYPILHCKSLQQLLSKKQKPKHFQSILNLPNFTNYIVEILDLSNI